MTDDVVWERAADDPVDERIVVGRWGLSRRGAELADVTHGGVLVLRGIRFVTRDHDWRTADDVVLTRSVTVDDRGRSAHIRIEASSRYDGAEVLRTVLDVVLADDTLTVDAVGTTSVPFRRNRIGLVVLHPPTLAGSAFTVQHPVAPPSEHVFPTWIAPHQPATDIAGLAWSVGGLDTDLTLAGDGFEMEDQRNWTDASYKTYSTPLSEPFPVALPTGAAVHQTLALRCARSDPGGAPSPAPDLTDLDGPPPTTVVTPAPTLQLTASSAPAAARPVTDGSPHAVPVLVEAVLADADVDAVLASARRDARGAGLDVRFVTDDPVRLRRAIDAVLDAGPVARIGAFDPSSHVTTVALQGALLDAARAIGDLEVVAGSRAHFTELNRTIERYRSWDGPLTFSVTPQMHDRSRAQVTESLRMLRWVATSASRLAAGRALHVGPVTLRPRFNAVATSPRRVVTDPTAALGSGAEFVPDATDPAQRSPAAAAWFARAVRALSVPGVATITLAEAWGPRGTPRLTGVDGAFGFVDGATGTDEPWP